MTIIFFKKHINLHIDLEVGEVIKIEGWGRQFDGKTVTIQEIKKADHACQSGVVMKVSRYPNFIDIGWATKIQ